MRRHYWVGGVVVAIGSMLVAGCGSMSSAKQAPQKPNAAASLKRERVEERAAEKRAEAHAHYAAGVVHEMNLEPQAAWEEYYQAAVLDPGDEALILDVSRRLLQAKQTERALEIVTRAAAQPSASGEIDARLGLIYFQLGKVDQSVAANRAAIKKSPDLLVGYQNLFLSYLRDKQPPRRSRCSTRPPGRKVRTPSS